MVSCVHLVFFCFCVFLLISVFLSLSFSLFLSSLCACVRRGAWTNDAVQRLRAAVHQLHQWEATAILQSSYVRARTRRVRARGYCLDLHRFRHGSPTDYWSDREGKPIRAGHGLEPGSLAVDPVTYLANYRLNPAWPWLFVNVVCFLPMLFACIYLITYVSSSLHQDVMDLTRKNTIRNLSRTSEKKH